MADDVNKSSRGPMNNFGMSDIEKIGQSAYSIPKSEQQQRMRASTARDQLNALSDIPDDVIASSSAMSRVARQAPNTIRSAEARIRASIESRLERSNIQATNAIGREYTSSAINGQVRSMMNGNDLQNRSMTMMSSSYEELASRREAINGQIQGIGQHSSTLARNIFSSRGVRKDIYSQISTNASTAAGMTQDIASIDLAMKTMRQNGSDPLSRYEALSTSGRSANNMLGAASLGEEIRNGGVNISRGGQQTQVANKDINAALANEANNLAEKLKELANSAGKSTEELDKLRKGAEESASNFEKLKAASGAGGGNNYGQYAQYANAAGGMFNAAGSAIQQIAVGQRLGQVANISGYAGIENQKYDAYKAARGGDVLSQMTASGFGGAEGFGRELKLGQQVAVGAYTAGSVAQGVAGGFQMAEAGAEKGNPLAYASGAATQNTSALLGGAQNVTQGIAGTATNGLDLMRGVSTNAAAIQGTQAQMEARRAVMRVQAEQLQGFRDFGVGMGVAAQGMGGRGEAFLQNSLSDRGMQNNINARMSPEQMAQMSTMGVSSMGSQFQQSQIFSARGLERSGMGSMGENMQRMSALAGAGSNNPQAGLGSVLEAAFTKGLDSSKALSAVAENTAFIMKSTVGAAVGIDTTMGSAAMVAAGINRSNPNQEFAVARATAAADITNTNANSTDVSFSGMLNTARLSKKLGIGGDEAISLQKVDIPTLRAMQGKSQKEQEEFLVNRGIDASGQRASSIINGALDAKGNSILEAGGTGIAFNIDSDKIRKKIQGGETLSRDERLKLGRVGVLAGYTGANELSSQVSGIVENPTVSAADRAAASMKGEGGSATLKNLDDLRTSGFKQLSEAALQATKNLGGAANALKTLTELSSNFEKMGTGGAEGKFGTAAADANASFGKSTMTFERAVFKFDEIVNRSGLGRDSGSDKAKQEIKSLSDKAGSALNEKKGR